MFTPIVCFFDSVPGGRTTEVFRFSSVDTNLYLNRINFLSS